MASPESMGSPLAGGLTRAQGKDALRRIQMSLETLQRQIDESVSQIGEVPRKELHTFLARQRDACQRWHGEQQQEWAALLGEDEEAADSYDSKVRVGTRSLCLMYREGRQKSAAGCLAGRCVRGVWEWELSWPRLVLYTGSMSMCAGVWSPGGTMSGGGTGSRPEARSGQVAPVPHTTEGRPVPRGSRILLLTKPPGPLYSWPCRPGPRPGSRTPSRRLA